MKWCKRWNTITITICGIPRSTSTMGKKAGHALECTLFMLQTAVRTEMHGPDHSFPPLLPKQPFCLKGVCFQAPELRDALCVWRVRQTLGRCGGEKKVGNQKNFWSDCHRWWHSSGLQRCWPLLAQQVCLAPLCWLYEGAKELHRPFEEQFVRWVD